MRNVGPLLLLLFGCAKSEPTKDPGPAVTPVAPEITVALAGVTLADDCGDGAPTKPLPPPPSPAAAGSGQQPASPAASMPAAESVSAGACAGPGCGALPQPACEQTSMQVALRAPAGAAATKIRIKQIELLDHTGKSVGTLTARAPSKWDGKGTYVSWDEALAAGTELVASYKLSAPDWTTLTGGRWNAPSKRFSLRVTVTISDKDRTIEKQSIVPTTPEPAVAT
jgi:hypothetical protein